MMICCTLMFVLLLSLAVLSQDTVCKPRPAWSSCPATPECDGILRKWYSQGCLGKGGQKLLDGGCQCQGYCGYKCASACKADPECTWNAAKKTCFNIATNLPGKAITTCTATRNPTAAPSKSPTRTPSLSPSKAPTPPTRSPTNVPSNSPTKSLCHRDTKFPGAQFTNGTAFSKAFGISSAGNSVAFYSGYFEYEMGSHDGIWVTTLNQATGQWKPQRVVEYFTAEDDYEDRTFPQAAFSGNGNFLFVVAGESRNTAANNCSFYKRQANGKFTLQTRLTVSGRMGPPQKLWISATGNRALVSYYDGPRATPVTVNFVRINNAWTIDWTQDDLPIVSVSPDGNSALAVSFNWMIPRVSRFICIRQGKKWVQQTGDLVGTGLNSWYQGSDASSFTPDGNTLVLGSWALYDDDYEPDWAPEDSGAWIFVRSNGTWTQQGPKLGGGGNMHDGYYTGITDDKKTIMISSGVRPYGFFLFKQAGSTYTQLGKVITNAKNPMMSRDGTRVVTNVNSPKNVVASLWKC